MSSRSARERARSPMVVVVALLLGGSRCGPNPEEVASTLLVLTPLAYAVAAGVLGLFRRAWRRRWTDVDVPRGRELVTFLCLVPFPIVGFGVGTPEYLGPGAILYTASATAVALFMGRVWFRHRTDWVVQWAALVIPVTIVLLSFAMVAASGQRAKDLMDMAINLVGVTGVWIGPVVLAGLLIEVVVVAVKRRRNEAPDSWREVAKDPYAEWEGEPPPDGSA